MTETVIGPITPAWIAAYAAASGDHNPLHSGPSAIVHGAMIAALIERYILGALPDAKIMSMNFRFLSPVKAGESLVFALGQGRVTQLDGKHLTEQRITVRVPGQRPCVLADCTYETMPAQ